MDWIQFATFMIGNMVFTLSLWFWARSESREDNRRIENTVTSLLTAIKDEMKDFHGRLCAIEERTKERK